MITGGHLTPALATIEEIFRKFPEWRMVFVGRKHALEGSRTISEEYRIIHDLGMTFLPLTTGRFKQDKSPATILSLLKIPVGCIQSLYYLLRHRPTVIISFGGYVAFPIAITGWILGIPVVTHEQTMRPGLANRMIARVARVIAVNTTDAVHQFKSRANVIVTGLPMRGDILHAPKKSPIPIPTDTPLLLIVGGSTGSVSVNTVVFDALPKLVSHYTVLHQVGSLSQEKAEAAKFRLPEQMRTRYLPFPYLSSPLYAWALKHTVLLIGRSGANTVMEAAASGAIAIWIPLPWASGNEQYHNAQVLVARGSSVILKQSLLTPKTLLDTIADMMATKEEKKRAAKEIAAEIPHDGASKLVDIVEHIISSTHP